MRLVTNEEKLFMNFVENDDFESFELLFNKTSPWLYKCIYRIVANKQKAEDILQDSWAIMIEHKNSFNPEKGKFGNLIFTIAKNLAFKEIAKSKDSLFVINNIIVNRSISKEKNPVEILQSNEIIIILNQAIYKLKKEYQDVILLFYYGDLTIKKIAIELSIPENTVRTYLSRGRKNIETILRNDSQIDLNSLLEIMLVV